MGRCNDIKGAISITRMRMIRTSERREGEEDIPRGYSISLFAVLGAEEVSPSPRDLPLPIKGQGILIRFDKKTLV